VDGAHLVSGGIAQYVAWILIDADLVRHDEAERAIEADLAAIFTRLGRLITAPEAAPLKGRHHAVGRSLRPSSHSVSIRSGGCVIS